MGSVSYLSGGTLQSVMGSAPHVLATNGRSKSSASAQPDSTQLSPIARLMNTLSQLQQSNPSKYREVTQQIATNLQKAATTAQSEGDATEADQLSQLRASSRVRR